MRQGWPEPETKSAKTDMDTELEVEALAHERLRLHDQTALASVAASLVAGGVLVPALWGQTSHAGLVAWFFALLAVGGVRYAGRQAHLRAVQGSAVQSWLHRYQALFLLQGLVWLCLLPLLTQVPTRDGLDVATLVITALVGGSLVTGAFDLRAASLFAWPTALPLFARLLGRGGPSEWLLAAASALFIALMLGAARRASLLFARQAHAAAQARERLAQAEAHARDAEAARRELSAVHERTEQLLRGTPLGYWFVDPQGRTLDVNPAMCDLLGRSREEVLKLGVFDCFTGAERAVLEAELMLRRQGKTGGYEIDIVRPDGARRHTFNQATPIYDAQGLHTGSIGLWTDLTAQKNLEVELRTYERVTNSITDVVAVVDAQRNLCLVNDAWCSMVGVSRADVLGTPFTPDALSLAEPERHAALEACFAQGKASTVTVRSSWPDGRLALLQTQFHPYRDGGSATERVILVTRDITDQASDRLAAEVSAEYLRQTLNATGDAVFASDADDPDAPLSFANDPLLRMWDIEGKRPGTLTLNDVLEAAGRQFAEPGIELLRTREINEGSHRHQSRVRLRDGRVLHRRFEPAIVAGRRLRVWSFRDVTAEEQLLTLMQDREAQQRALLDAFPGFISRFDAGLRYTYVNGPLARLAGQEPGALLGRHLSEVIGPEGAAQILALTPQVLAGQPVVLEREHLGPQGPITTQLTLASGRDPVSGKPVLYAFGADITSLKQAEEALRAGEREMRALLQAFPGYIASVDRELRFRYADGRLAALLGRPVEQVVGHTLAEVLGEESSRVLGQELLRAREGEVVSVQRTYRSPGSAVPIDLELTHVAGSVGPDGQQLVYSFGQDITARNLALEALAKARDEAERANMAKSQFLSHMSHELRTPMNAIVGFSQLLRRDSRPPLAPHQQGYAQQILQGAEHLLKLINEVLDLGSIEAGRLAVELSPVPVCEVADDALAFVRELAHGHGVHLEPTLELDPADLEPHAQVVLADRTRLRQVMLNLLGNAIKYNRPGGSVKMRCRRDGGQVVIEVLDTGRGIPAAEQQRLFQPFERLGAERGAVEGAGIGLALSRRLVLAMAGQMGLSSEPGVGSTFWLSLPVAVIAPPPAPPTLLADLQQTAGAGAQATVLYVDDNEVNLMLMEALLEDSDGVRLISCKDPAEGLRLAQQQRPSVVLLDIHMPGMDGYEVLARLRAHPATAHIPVVAVSADAMPADLDAARSAGFAAYLTKPLDFEQLLRTVDQLSQPGQNADSSAP